MFFDVRAVCEHSEFAFSTGILSCFLASELFASIANSRFGRDAIVFIGFRAVCEHSEFAFSTGIL